MQPRPAPRVGWRDWLANSVLLRNIAPHSLVIAARIFLPLWPVLILNTSLRTNLKPTIALELPVAVLGHSGRDRHKATNVSKANMPGGNIVHRVRHSSIRFPAGVK